MNILNVDIDKVTDKIYEYIGVHNELPYIICSDDTEKLILTKCYESRLTVRVDRYLKGRDTITKYYGCTILNDNSLKLGEVKIR